MASSSHNPVSKLSPQNSLRSIQTTAAVSPRCRHRGSRTVATPSASSAVLTFFCLRQHITMRNCLLAAVPPSPSEPGDRLQMDLSLRQTSHGRLS